MKSIQKIEEIILECEKTRKKAHEDSNYKLRDFLHWHIQDLEKLKNIISTNKK